MTSALYQRIQDDMKAAMRAKEALALSTIRMLIAAVKQREIDERKTLDDTEVLAIVQKLVKQRQESIKQFRAAARDELADKEQLEIEVLQQYLPEAASEEVVDQAIQQAITETGASGIKDMGKVMTIVKTTLQGRADMGAVSAKVKATLSDG